MDNLLFFIIVVGVILVIYYIHHTAPDSNKIDKIRTENKESFDNTTHSNMLDLNPYARCELMSKKKFMIRDLRTKLWLISGQEEGFNKFLPGRFGNVFMMSNKPDEYLPLRTLSEPNDYLLATYKGNGIRTVTNPYNQNYIIQVFIYNGFNVLGYLSDANIQLYLYIDNDGHISSVTNPENSSKIEIIEV